MGKQMTFTFDEKEYVLEFTRKTVKAMEDQGFVIEDIGTKPMSVLPALWAGAFRANHPWVKKDLIDKIYERVTNRSELVQKLAELYNEPIAALIDEPDENEGNVQWRTNF